MLFYSMLFNFSNVLVFFLVGAGFVFVSLTLGKLVRPSVPLPEKLTTYECGELPTEKAWMNFNIRFYILALIFIIFDVEVAFMFPIAVVFRQWIQEGKGTLALIEVSLFVLILLLGLVYAWIKGDLEWVRKIQAEPADGNVVSRASHI